MEFYTTHNTGGLTRDLVVGTSYLDTITVSYDTLVDLFGQPLRSFDPAKTKAEWIIRFNGQILTIYDYRSGTTVLNNKVWSIGGFKKSREAATELALVIYGADEEA